MHAIEFKTPLDYQTSHITGWTRDHWEEVFFTLMKGILDSASRYKARQRIPGPRSHHGLLADELEGFTRSLFMSGPWLSSSKDGILNFGKESIDVLDFYRQGILAGTDPKHPEYWGEIVDYAQHLVEMAALCWGLYVSREKIWDKFSKAEKKQVADYLIQCTQVKYHQNNWLLFNVITNAVLKQFGMPYSQEQIDENLGFCDSMYVGNGWYCDGHAVNRFDYYNAWGFHFYYLLWAIIDGESKPDIAEMHKERVRQFAQNFRYFFAGDGSTPCWGRSMIYRFGYVSPIALGQYLDCLDISSGQVRTMCNSTMKFYFSNPILTDRNHLSMGWLRPNEFVLEHYNCGGSPLWATKSMALLFIPQDDPFWTQPEEELPIHQKDFSFPIKEPGLVMIGRKDSGHVQIINQKPYHDKSEYNARYTNFAYSSIFSYEARPIYKSWNCDNSLTFSTDGINFKQRWKTENLYCETDFAAARYPMHEVDDNGIITTFILVKDDVMINIHRIEPSLSNLVFREGGYSLGFDEGETQVFSKPGIEYAIKDDKITFIRNLYGYTRSFKARGFHEDVCGANSRYHKSVVPAFGTERQTDEPFYLASMVCGRMGNVETDELEEFVKSFRIVDNRAELVFYDDEHVMMQMGPVQSLSININALPVTGKVVLARISSDAKLNDLLYEDGSLSDELTA
ncbi:MAG: DUF2264 domain-containing protein [candidate division KSB1 bacterium]|nr:DUF2264 domain-containing protein [candidate division KSB1 bacterium]